MIIKVWMYWRKDELLLAGILILALMILIVQCVRIRKTKKPATETGVTSGSRLYRSDPINFPDLPDFHFDL